MPPEGDFSVTVKVMGRMTHNYNSASLGIYADNTSVVQMARRFHTGLAAKVDAVPSKLGSVGNVIDFMTRTTKYTEKYVADKQFADSLWMKIERVGDTFYGYYSYDGKNFTAMPSPIENESVSSCKDLKIVLACYVGSSETYVMDVSFEDFTLDGEKIPFTKTVPIKSGDVRFEDVIAVLKKSVNKEYVFAADSNRDGKLSLLDVLKLIKTLVE